MQIPLRSAAIGGLVLGLLASGCHLSSNPPHVVAQPPIYISAGYYFTPSSSTSNAPLTAQASWAKFSDERTVPADFAVQYGTMSDRWITPPGATLRYVFRNRPVWVYRRTADSCNLVSTPLGYTPPTPLGQFWTFLDAATGTEILLAERAQGQ